MVDLRRRSPEAPPSGPTVEFKPGLADEMMREMAPLLAEEGINLDDPDGIDVPDMATLQRAFDRAVERSNLARFTPVGVDREFAAATLRRAVGAIVDGDTMLAGAVLDSAEPESADHSVATVAACIGVALGLLDEWLSGRVPDSPAGLAQATRLPAGHWVGERAATDILTLARKGRAVRSLDSLIVRQGSVSVLYGATLALAAAVQAWSALRDFSVPELIEERIR